MQNSYFFHMITSSPSNYKGIIKTIICFNSCPSLREKRRTR